MMDTTSTSIEMCRDTNFTNDFRFIVPKFVGEEVPEERSGNSEGGAESLNTISEEAAAGERVSARNPELENTATQFYRLRSYYRH